MKWALAANMIGPSLLIIILGIVIAKKIRTIGITITITGVGMLAHSISAPFLH